MFRPGITYCAAAMLFLSTGIYPARDTESETLPQPGPENAGLRLRLVVTSERVSNEDVHHVRLDLINATDQELTVSTDWPHENEGDFEEYFESATSIHTYPEVMDSGIQVLRDTRESPQPRHTISAQEMLTVQWTTHGRQLKNKVTRPTDNPNPSFPSAGLYSVHAGFAVPVDSGAAGDIRPVVLRSNEQLVSVGGSMHAPKQAVVQVYNVAADHSTCEIGVGSIG